ncbi:MAG TPA: hypothetical protein VER26_01135 [Xanthobacteraceae bacterium]|nr:hypothetical protein [Xanthobacteraceae bacterium]HYQ05569.1 hypothetical protein [Xanthobacteraceae bacterium]
MRLLLRHAMQIEAEVDFGMTARHTLPQATIKLRQRGRLLLDLGL